MKRRGVDVVFVTMLVMFLGSSAHAQVPAAINYQGVLVDKNGELTGPHTLEFNLYDAPTGGSLIWGPQTFDSVLFVQGHFNVILSSTDGDSDSIADAFDGPDRYLGINVDGGAEISPRQRILSVPYAIHAESAGSAESAESAGSVQFSTNSDPIPKQSIYWDKETGDIVMRNDGADEENKGFRFDNYTSTMVRISEQGLEAPACRICLRYDNAGWERKEGWLMEPLSGQTCVPLIANSRGRSMAFYGPQFVKDAIWNQYVKKEELKGGIIILERHFEITFECKIYNKVKRIWEWPELSDMVQREFD